VTVTSISTPYVWLADKVQPGITTNELDKAVHAMIIAGGAYPSPLGYSSFPRSCTTSVNNVIARQSVQSTSVPVSDKMSTSELR
jgi:methionyl aminopeptidase